MRKILILLSLLVLVSPGLAQPLAPLNEAGVRRNAWEQIPAKFIGNWKLDVAASKYGTAAPKMQYRIFDYTADGKFLCTYITRTARDTYSSGNWAVQLDGTPGMLKGARRFVALFVVGDQLLQQGQGPPMQCIAACQQPGLELGRIGQAQPAQQGAAVQRQLLLQPQGQFLRADHHRSGTALERRHVEMDQCLVAQAQGAVAATNPVSPGRAQAAAQIEHAAAQIGPGLFGFQVGPQQKGQGLARVLSRLQGQVGQQGAHLVVRKRQHRALVEANLEGTEKPQRQTCPGST